MKIDVGSSVPIFLQIAQQLEDSIFIGVYDEETQVPSTNELSVLHNINPQTVLKGMNLLVNEGIIYKKRGIGMFVAEGALLKIKQKRMNIYYDKYVIPMLSEARSLGYSKQQLSEMIERGYSDEQHKG